MPVVVLVKAFYTPIALRVPDRTENEFCPHVKSKTNNLTQDSWMGESTAKASFVVRLGVSRNTDFLPDVDQESLGVHGPSAFIGLACWIARDDIDGIKTSY
jgi:hypothetical protein